MCYINVGYLAIKKLYFFFTAISTQLPVVCGLIPVFSEAIVLISSNLALIQVLQAYKDVSVNDTSTYKQSTNSQNASNSDVPDKEKKEDKTLVDKAKKFCKEHKTEIIIVGGVVTVGIIYLLYKFYFPPKEFYFSDSDDEDKGGREGSSLQHEEENKKREQQKPAWKRERDAKARLERRIGPLRSLMYTPDNDEYTAYVIAATKALHKTPLDFYFFDQIASVVNTVSVINVAGKMAFLQFAEFLVDPSKLSQNIAGKIDLFGRSEDPELRGVSKDMRVFFESNYINKYRPITRAAASQLPIMEFMEILTDVLLGLKLNSNAGPKLDQLAELAKMSHNYCNRDRW
jgi:hypothetical protein